jgi:iron complex outermembrane receptor protein
VVTARKREESLLKVPVIAAAIAKGTLERFQVTEVRDLQKMVPGLNLGHGPLAIGTLVSIRGIGTAAQDPGVDQSVSLNIDGLALGSGLAFSSGMFDVQQVEVLKGPQALFYGKSSPGGVISIRTADPTSDFELIARTGYEFEADTRQADLIVSGSVSPTLTARVAGRYSASTGYFHNDAVALLGTGAKDPIYDRDSRSRNYYLRGTLLWKPSSDFSARLKANLTRERAISPGAGQLTSCPNGLDIAPPPFRLPFIGGDECKLNRSVRIVYMDPESFPGISNDGVPFILTKQKYSTLELNYDVTPQIALTSTSGYYNLRSSSLLNVSLSTAAGPTLAYENYLQRRDVTQELRLNTDFAGPLNLTVGGFFQDALLANRVWNQGNAAYGLRGVRGHGRTQVDIKTYSAFAQARWRIFPELELSGGARYTDETRKEVVTNLITDVIVPVARPRVHASNVAPELTITYTPTDDLTLFGAYKKGYKSGSFSIAVPPRAGADNSFGDEEVEGGEIGVKARLLERSLNLNLAYYDYRYTGLQVGTVEPAVAGVVIVRVVNAGKAVTRGVEFDANYRPPGVDGLALNAAVNYNHGRYTELSTVPCYVGQTVEGGCKQALNPVTGRYTAQDLSGTPLIRAPDWQASFGFEYALPISDSFDLVLANNNQYSSRYPTGLAIGRPNDDQYQTRFFKSDLSLTLKSTDNRWEVALVGKNIGDKLTTGNCSASARSSGLFGGGITGGPAGGPGSGLIGEMGCYTDPGREVWIRLTVRPFA